eukprot:TRINITY_DN19057_c0_g1_i1.p1 TRINITY_DN19057_c0_g1~~TRINITY_DN19057_c0_g1_i1.p1  ORF type:complete len:304 (-),score=132.35 TRINITY_DN19057_c0_g1_i1:209-1120(-)
MSLPLFKDVGKRVSDLLTKDFPSDKKEQKAEWKSTTQDGVKLEFNVKTESGKGEPKTVGLIKNEFVYKPFAVNVVGELNTDREAKVELSTQDKFVKGLKGIFAVQSQAKKHSLEYFETVSFEYRHQLVSATGSAEIGRATDNALKGSLVLGSQGVTVGTSAEYVRKESSTELKDLKTSLGYASDEFDVIAYGKVAGSNASRTTEVGASYYHKLSGDFAVGTEIKFDVTNKDTDKKPVLTFGTSWRHTPTALFKGRFDTEGKLSLSYAQEVNKSTKFLVGTTIKTADPSAKDGTQFGFTLSLNG